MAHASDLIATDIDAYLAEHERKDLLRLLTCGSVDDGKSTLIGRLLHDNHLVYEDHLAALEADSATVGHAGGALDLALLTDGLKAEREQGITIDVAYRYVSTARRKFIIADTPGHEQYTRNMVTGASTADLAVVMVDARRGVLPQTRRHSAIAHLLGIRHVAVCVNKMDLVGWSQGVFDDIVADYRDVAERLGAGFDVAFLPVAALEGDNVVHRSERMPWYGGPTLMSHLETVDVTPTAADDGRVRLPVQLVIRPDTDFRGFAGTLTAGLLRPGDAVTALPSGRTTTVERIVTFDGDLDVAGPGDAVTVTLAEEIDCSRGDVLVGVGQAMGHAERIDADLVWMAETTLKPGRPLLLQSATGTTGAAVATIRHRVDVEALHHEPAEALELNDIARCTLTVEGGLLFDPYDVDRETGSFILIDRLTNATVGAGMVRGTADLRDTPTPARAAATVAPVSAVTPAERAERYGQRPVTILLAGSTGTGEVASTLERLLFDAGHVAVRLEGQRVRQVAETARLLNDQGLIAIATLPALDATDHALTHELVGTDRVVETAVDDDASTPENTATAIIDRLRRRGDLVGDGI